MAGFDTVDPAYACVLPVSPVVSRSPTPRSRRIVLSPKTIRSPIGLGSFPDPRDIPAFADPASQAKSRVLTHESQTQDRSLEAQAQGRIVAPREGHRTVRPEFHCLYASAGSGLPVFRRSQILPAW